MKDLNAAQVEAIEVANAHLNNADLPLYSDLMAALESISAMFSRDNPRPPVWIAQDMAETARVAIAKAQA